MYATIDDLRCAFGDKELLGLADRPNQVAIGDMQLKCDINDADVQERLEKALKWACSFIDRKLANCCFDIVAIKAKFTTDGICSLNLWSVQLARYYLYDSIQLSGRSGGMDHESYRRKEEIEEELKEICQSGRLVDDAGNVCCSKKQPSFCVEEKTNCLDIEDMCCVCQKSSCCCGDHVNNM